MSVRRTTLKGADVNVGYFPPLPAALVDRGNLAPFSF
jgi:hypothetical protein